jgi:hypothetical protein
VIGNWVRGQQGNIDQAVNNADDENDDDDDDDNDDNDDDDDDDGSDIDTMDKANDSFEAAASYLGHITPPRLVELPVSIGTCLVVP